MLSNNKKGIGMVEAIVVISIMSVSFAAILSAAIFFLRGGLFAVDQVQSVFLLDESAEAVRFMRDQSFSTNIAPLVGTGPTYLAYDSTGWNATSTNTLIHGTYTRSIELTEVYRKNSDDTIVPTSSAEPKTLDTGTVRLKIMVSWSRGANESTTYVTDLYEN
jgi:hypothetical protein